MYTIKQHYLENAVDFIDSFFQQSQILKMKVKYSGKQILLSQTKNLILQRIFYNTLLGHFLWLLFTCPNAFEPFQPNSILFPGLHS
jgi:hypothetical protein